MDWCGPVVFRLFNMPVIRQINARKRSEITDNLDSLKRRVRHPLSYWTLIRVLGSSAVFRSRSWRRRHRLRCRVRRSRLRVKNFNGAITTEGWHP